MCIYSNQPSVNFFILIVFPYSAIAPFHSMTFIIFIIIIIVLSPKCHQHHYFDIITGLTILVILIPIVFIILVIIIVTIFTSPSCLQPPFGCVSTLFLRAHQLSHLPCPYYHYCCSLSLWRVARGSKRMFLELIHGLFIT